MTGIVEYDHGDCTVQIVTQEAAVSAGPAQKAGIGGGMFGSTAAKAGLTLQEAAGVVGRLAAAFSKSLQEADLKPDAVEVSFGLEASGELGNFLVSKLSAKTNFSVKMSWSFK